MKKVFISVMMLDGQFKGSRRIDIVIEQRLGASAINVYGSDQPGVAAAFAIGFNTAAGSMPNGDRPWAMLWDPSAVREHDTMPKATKSFYRSIHGVTVESLMRRAKAKGGDPTTHVIADSVPDWAQSASMEMMDTPQ